MKSQLRIGILIVGLSITSCYEKFDADSYKPPFTISGFTSSSSISPTNLVAYWPFDGTYSESVSGGNGSGVSTSFVNGFKGQALQGALNGFASSDPTNAVKALTSFTLSFWVNTPPPSTGVIGLFSLSKTDGYWGNIEMFVENGSSNANGKLRTVLYNGTGDTTFASDGLLNLFDRWVSITLSYDGPTSTYRLYVNGSLVSTITRTGFGNLSVKNAGKIIFGTPQFMATPSIGCCGPQSWASFLTGQLDEVRIYNKVLSAEEINALVILQGKGK